MMKSSPAAGSYRVIVVGGGTAGISIAARLARRLPAGSVALLEPNETHYYQPLFTLVGGGVATLADASRPMASLIPEGVHWIKERVTAFDPDMSAVETARGRYRYDYLVACPGIQIDWNQIPGLPDALASGAACSNYSEEFVVGTTKALAAFQGGVALFTHPNTPIKCGGAPQKIMYLAEHAFRRRGIRDKSRVIFACAPERLFAVEKYRVALDRIVSERGIEARLKHNLVAVDGARRVATLEDLATATRTEQPYDFLHVTPPMRAPEVVRRSALAAREGGWIDVDKATLQHVRYPNVFAAGDASSLPTSKTGAAIRKQAPVLVHNLLAVMRGKKPDARYDGYTSCPIVTGYGRLILAEFDYEGRPRETFPFDQSKERRSMYHLKKDLLPALYWHGMMRGLV